MPQAKFLVSGRVQGVWFRESTRREASKLGISGYAKNLPDGTVEVFACGSAEALDELAGWLAQGPPLASVDAVERQDNAPGDCPDAFFTA